MGINLGGIICGLSLSLSCARVSLLYKQFTDKSWFLFIIFLLWIIIGLRAFFSFFLHLAALEKSYHSFLFPSFICMSARMQRKKGQFTSSKKSEESASCNTGEDSGQDDTPPESMWVLSNLREFFRSLKQCCSLLTSRLSTRKPFFIISCSFVFVSVLSFALCLVSWVLYYVCCNQTGRVRWVDDIFIWYPISLQS